MGHFWKEREKAEGGGGGGDEGGPRGRGGKR
jgi:hypothetical protein